MFRCALCAQPPSPVFLAQEEFDVQSGAASLSVSPVKQGGYLDEHQRASAGWTSKENSSIALQVTVLTEKLRSSKGKHYFYLLVFCSWRPQYAPAKVQLSNRQLLSVLRRTSLALYSSLPEQTETLLYCWPWAALSKTDVIFCYWMKTFAGRQTLSLFQL